MMLTRTQTVGRLAIVIKAVKILEHVCNHFRQGALRHTNSNKWKEILMNPGKSTTKKAAKSTAANNKKSSGFSDEEKAAARARIKELKAEAEKADGESTALAAIAAMQEPDRSMAKRIHAIIKDSAPPSWRRPGMGCPRMLTRMARSSATSNLHRSSTRGTRRLSSRTLRTSMTARCGRSPSHFKKLTAAEEAKISALVKKAAS